MVEVRTCLLKRADKYRAFIGPNQTAPSRGGHDFTVSKEDIRSRMEFCWQMFRANTPDSSASALRDDLQHNVDTLGTTFFDKLAKEAGETWHCRYAGKTEITRMRCPP